MNTHSIDGSDKLLESELSSLECYTEYQLEAPLNSFNDHKLNNHLYVIYSTKRRETVQLMRQSVEFYVCQHRTKMNERVKDYLETKKTVTIWMAIGCKARSSWRHNDDLCLKLNESPANLYPSMRWESMEHSSHNFHAS